MSYKLVIVESPTKVKSIGQYLKPAKDYKVTSSMGHIRDLPKKGGMNIDIQNDFTPNYQVSADKKKIVGELKKLAKNASEVIMASDEDREGEAIAWHLCHTLNLNPQTTKRIVFHEITADALKKALSNPRYIDQDLVDAQQARRILDRIVGFELSPVLWKKIRPGLSAGRVQSVAMRLIYEREEEIVQFKAQSEYEVKAKFEIKGQPYEAELKTRFANLKDSQAFLELCQKSQFQVQSIDVKKSFRKPSPPFKTSTLQQEASQRLGFSIKQTMVIAQKLYEKGLITYMRTDSLNLSEQALQGAQRYIVKELGAKYYQQTIYQQKSKGAQEAHEAIRPTNLSVKQTTADAKENKLYHLIWQRTIASQMTPAQLEKTTANITMDNSEHVFTLKGQTLKFAGFLKITEENLKDVLLPALKINQKLQLLQVLALEKFSNPPARFSEASLVKKLEELGIGRPSTYAPIIATILDRGYVEKGDVTPSTRRFRGLLLQDNKITPYDGEDTWGGATNKLIPTELAKLVTPFLTKYFSQIMDYNFTSKIETDFDKIAQGRLYWVKHLKDFYKEFHPQIKSSENISRQEISHMREVGIDPQDGQMIYARLGRFGPMLQKGLAEDKDKKPIFTPLPKDATIQTVTVEQAQKMFKLPRLLGETEDKEEIWVKLGPFGPYLKVGKTNVPLKDYDPFEVSLEQALVLVEKQKEANRKKIIADFGKIKILQGPFGPYITDGEKNSKIPKKEQDKKGFKLDKISQEQATTWLKELGKPIKKRFKRASKKK